MNFVVPGRPYFEVGPLNGQRHGSPAARWRGSSLFASLALLSVLLRPVSVAGQSSTNYGNPGTIIIPNGSSVGIGATPYPSLIYVGTNGAPSLAGTIQRITITLTNLNYGSPEGLGLILVAPNGTACEFMAAAAGTGSGSPFTLTFDDAATNSLPQNSVPASGIYLPTSLICYPSCNTPPDPYPSPAPVIFDAAPPRGTATLLGEFGGLEATGAWSLFLANRTSTGTPGTLGGWSLNFTMRPTAHPTATVVTSSENPAFAGATITNTATVSVTDGSGLQVNAGTVSFTDGLTTLAANVPVANGVAMFVTNGLGEGTHRVLASYSGVNSGTNLGISSGHLDQRIDEATVLYSSAPEYSYNNPGPVAIPGGSSSGGYSSVGPAGPYPSNIFITNLPGTVKALTITLKQFHAHVPNWLTFLLVGPGGRTLDFFSRAGGSSVVGPFDVTFDDTASSSAASGVAGGSFKPTSESGPNSYPACPFNAVDCQSASVGPPAPGGPYTYAQPAGTAILGNANAAGVFGGTTASTVSGNGTWSLYAQLLVEDANSAGLSGGWSLNFTVNTPALSVTASHSGNFCQGQGGAQCSVTVSNGGPGPTGGPVPATVVDTFPNGLTPVAASGSGWTCVISNQTVTCTRSDPTAAGTSYPAITLFANVATNAPGSLTNKVTLSGGGDATPGNHTAADRITINPMPVASISPSPPVPCPNSTGNQALAGAGAATYSWSITNGTITGPTNLQTVTYTAGSSGSVGLTLRVSNASGCTATNTLSVPTLIDTTPPTITCSSNITVTAFGQCPVTVSFSVSASDNCTLSNVVATPSSGTAFPVGTNIVVVVATDAAGNTNTCSFQVTVMAGPPPDLAAALVGTNLVLSWPAAGACYSLQSTPSLASNSWTNYAGPRTTNAGSLSITDSVAGSRFYRLMH
ncbi:MAG TPA: HYR domain-containing protein [Candidatus Acidoferrum sp.]|nr:HYR domain-containing protein [Candidatus Acidoferrum sp.]